MHTPRLLVGKFPGNAKHGETRGNAGEKCWRQELRSNTGDTKETGMLENTVSN